MIFISGIKEITPNKVAPPDRSACDAAPGNFFIIRRIMEEIKLIKNKNELEGTCYFEFLPGKYNNQCWQDDSVYLDEETFCLIAHIFEKNLLEYDYYSFMEIEKDQWPLIINDLEILGNQKKELETMIADLVNWLKATLKKESVISLLGL